MIYKILMEMKNFEDIIKSLSDKFYILFLNNSLYICDKRYKNVSKKSICKLLSNDNVCLIEINENNILYESNNAKAWCEDKFIKRDLKKLEDDKQEELKELMKNIDIFEDKLKNIIKNREGDTNGE